MNKAQVYDYLKQNNLLCYANNPQSLFRKYEPLISGLLRHETYRDYLNDGIQKKARVSKDTVKLLPNGRSNILGIYKDQLYQETVTSPHAIYAPKLYPALTYLDKAAPFLKTMDNAESFLLGQLGLLKPLEHWNEYREILQWFPHYATTTTARPDASVESTTVDGYAGRGGVNQTFANIRSGAGTDSSDTNANLSMYVQTSGTTDQFEFMYRNLVTIDFTGVDDAEEKDSITITVTGNGKTNNIGSPDLHFVTSTPASNTAVVNGDYGQTGTTSLGSLSYASFPATGATADTLLNATGLAAISLTAVSKFGARTSWDQSGTFGGVWSASVASNLPTKSRDSGATDSWLFTLVHHSAVSTSISKISGISQANIKKISGIAIANVKKVSGVANT